ncbi:MAG: DUF72 domain-containing protein [Gemmatimonadales bacterium]|nr:DUF72 domain-containing protein [Gemmatimonadales bacterium]NIN12528.1 DUF72 domain-containing protein [Gemmatimonadales bacterium]NIN50899.1 DUF72 domain-containing protein [Gemmatimonadales bacterium]NIP08363.1 DUF72 domain-containing protein [Gemmatimonadales bacterium]NIR03460.1 DUF72 domain-containing protein [Gemmatimonadales bacterium]
MRVLVGTSGYAYKEWKGSFYPSDLPNDQMLRFYAERFPTVEINNTFYRMPSEKVLLQWGEQVPDRFSFVLKASRRITHQHRLKDTQDPLAYLLKNASVLGNRLGPMLFQLPPNMKKDLPRLQDFLELLPSRWSAAFEFRHASWFEDDVYEALRSRNVALCVADTEDGETPFVSTATVGYLRLRRERYGKRELGKWAKRIADQPWDEAFVFFKHEDEGAGPKLAKRFAELIE